MPEEAQYNYLKVLGPLRMESVTPRDLKGERVRVCILMGPTGSGKSAFIEVLAPEQGLCISGDSLDGVTQTVVCYRVNNLQDGKLPVIIMDTPGLLDPGISESRVISMISNELDTLRGSVEMAVVTLCYFHAIDIARVAGTKRDAVEFLRGFAQTFKANNVNVVTTMWNKLWNDKQTTDAEQRFNALQVEIYRSLPSLHVSLDRFYSTAASTLSILDACRHGWYQTTRKQRITLPTYDNMIRQGLVGRIQNIQRNLDNFADDDHQVQAICEAEHKAALLLYEFCRDLYDCAPDAYSAIFPDAPCPPTTFDCQPSLSELVCYRSMSSMQIQPTSTGAASIHHAIPHHFPSPEPPLTDKLSWRWIKRFRMLEGRVREGIKAFAKPTKLVQAGDSQVLNVDPDLVAVISKLQNLTVTGNISVEPMTAEIPENAKVYILLGPAGSGKSSFVESLEKEQSLVVSKGLDCWTRTVTAYYVVNVLNAGCPIIILDTPGFHDSMISELEVMNMIPAWMEQNRIHFFHQILFLTPITERRIRRSERQTVEMLKALLTATHDLDSVLVITTMWDTIYNERIRNRAESHFTHLSSDVFKDFTDRGADITRCMNTKASALEILDRPLHKKRAFDVIGFTTTPHLYKDLYRHIQETVQEKQTLEAELSEPATKTDLNLKPVLDHRLREIEQILDKFIEKFIEYGKPPSQSAEDHQRLYELLLSMRPELRHRLPPSSVTLSDNMTSKATQDLTNRIPHSVQLPNTTEISQVLAATKD